MTAPTGSTPVTMYELDPELAIRIGMPPVPVPIRTERTDKIFSSDGVDLDALVREIDAVIGDNLEMSAQLGAVVARLADAVGQADVDAGELMDAVEVFEIGLKHRPEYPGLNTKMALALQIQGRLKEASKHYDIALIRRDEPINPMVLILAARNRADLGDAAGALDLLDRCPGSMWDDPSFRSLYLSWCDDLESIASSVPPSGGTDST